MQDPGALVPLKKGAHGQGQGQVQAPLGEHARALGQLLHGEGEEVGLPGGAAWGCEEAGEWVPDLGAKAWQELDLMG